jgi:hypothetical protein
MLHLNGGTIVVGEVSAREAIPNPGAPPGTPVHYRIQVQRGDRDVFGSVDRRGEHRHERPPTSWRSTRVGLLGTITVRHGARRTDRGRVASAGPSAEA